MLLLSSASCCQVLGLVQLLQSGSVGPGGTGGAPSSPLLAGFSAGSLLSAGGGGLPAYTLAELQADINRWPASYYSKQV